MPTYKNQRCDSLIPIINLTLIVLIELKIESYHYGFEIFSRNYPPGSLTSFYISLLLINIPLRTKLKKVNE